MESLFSRTLVFLLMTTLFITQVSAQIMRLRPRHLHMHTPHLIFTWHS